jgi:dienelactone hydrolase
MRIILSFLMLLLTNHAFSDVTFMVHSQEVNEDGLGGKIFFPTIPGPRPAVIVFSGSDGGVNEQQAELFAKAGYMAFALAFFNVDGLPQNLENIPLEYFLKGIRLFKSNPKVKAEKIHLYGPSKGGELVMLLASTFPTEIASAIAVVPSCVTFGGIPNEQAPSWTFAGKPLPIAPTPSREDVYRQLETRETVNLAQIFLEKMQDIEAFDRASIPVEHIQCPLLLISGRDDKMWPSWLYADLIMQRLEQFNSSIFREHLSYDHVGHMITSPYAPVMTESFKHPLTCLYYEVGGNPEAQALACQDSWAKILLFLARWSDEAN